MGSVLSEIDCPNCGRTAIEDYYYKTDEIYIFCQSCGYNKSSTLKRDDNGNVIKDEDGRWIYIDEESIPYCAFEIKKLGMSGRHVGSIETEGDFQKFKEGVKKNARIDGLEYVKIKRFDGENFEEFYLDMPAGKRKITEEDPYGEEEWEIDD